MRYTSVLPRFVRSRAGLAATLLAGTVLAFASSAHAQVTFNLTPPNVVYNPSTAAQTVVFSGTITNLGSSVVYLNDISVALDAFSSQFATPNTYLFFDSVPLSLAAAGDASGLDRYSGTVFGVDLDAGAQSQFFGTATLRGGATTSSQDVLGTLQQFTGNPSVIVPEPGAFPLEASALISMASIAFVRRRRSVS